MLNRPPNRNLPPESSEWGRWVERGLQGLDSALERSAQGVTRSLSSINASIKQIGNLIVGLEDTVNTIPITGVDNATIGTWTASASSTVTLASLDVQSSLERPSVSVFGAFTAGFAVNINTPQAVVPYCQIEIVDPGGAGLIQRVPSIFEKVGTYRANSPFSYTTTSSNMVTVKINFVNPSTYNKVADSGVDMMNLNIISVFG